MAELDNPYDHPRGDGPRAEAHYLEAARLLKALNDQHPESPEARNTLARTYLGLGRYYRSSRRPDDARAALGTASGIWDALKGNAWEDYPLRFRAEIRSHLDALGPVTPGGGGTRTGPGASAPARSPDIGRAYGRLPARVQPITPRTILANPSPVSVSADRLRPEALATGGPHSGPYEN
jgi:hypothetical protein